ncbi:hypothetical protein ACP275_06G071700 [Erythranthe tilingii]
MGSVSNSVHKPHAVCIPFPAQGHINPMLKLAKLLHNGGFHITFVNTEYNHHRLLKSRGPDSLTGLPSFRFETIPDGLPPPPEDAADATQDIPSLCESTTTTCLAPFRDLLAKLNDTASSDVPPVSCVVSDGVMSFTADAAEELGIPEVLFWTTSACGFYCYTQYGNVIEKGYAPLADTSCLTNGYLETVIEGIPNMEGMRIRDIPSFIRTTNKDDIYMVKFVLQETKRAKRASAIVLNTFEELERETINALSSILPPIYPIGPLNLIEKHVIEDKGLNLLGSNLWKEDQECLKWLDAKEPNSVVYVNFGSITVMTPDQLNEFAWGLANSKQPFLWVIRPNLVSGEKVVLPRGFLEETKERGMLANWCPQEKVLSHSSVGGFLTHSGWNSTLESIGSGVPMICWPFFAEQQTNCWYCCTKWGVGIEIDSDVKRNGVETLVTKLMVGEEGRQMRNKAVEWKNLARDSAEGSSYRNLRNLIDQVLLPKV